MYLEAITPKDADNLLYFVDVTTLIPYRNYGTFLVLTERSIISAGNDDLLY